MAWGAQGVPERVACVFLLWWTVCIQAVVLMNFRKLSPPEQDWTLGITSTDKHWHSETGLAQCFFLVSHSVRFVRSVILACPTHNSSSFLSCYQIVKVLVSVLHLR